MLRYRRPTTARKGLRDATNDMKRPAPGGGKEDEPSKTRGFEVPMSKKRRLQVDDAPSRPMTTDRRPLHDPRDARGTKHGIEIYEDPREDVVSSRPPSSENGLVTSLFQSGRGKSVLLPAKKIQEYEIKLSKPSEDEGKALAPDTDQAQSADHRQSTADGAAPGALVSSLFQTGSGRAVQVSAEKLRSYQKQLEAEAANEETARDEPSSSRESIEPAAPAIPSLFQTGRGRHVQVSADLTAKYRASFEAAAPDASNEQGEALPPMKRSVAAPSSSGGVTSLFSTAAGASVKISAAKVQQYQEALSREVTGTDVDSATTAEQPIVQSLFETGAGKHVHVSAAVVQRYQQQFAASDDNEVAPSAAADGSETVASLFQTGAGHKVHVSADKVKAYTKAFQADAASSSTHDADAVAPEEENALSLFSTASGRNVTVSAEKTKAYERLFDADTPADNDVMAPKEARDTTPSLFATGSGQQVDVSRQNVRAYEAKLQRDDSAFVALPTEEAGPWRPSGSDEMLTTKPNPQRRVTFAPGDMPRVAENPVPRSAAAKPAMSSTNNGRRAFQPPRRKSMPAPSVVALELGVPKPKPKEIVVQTKSKYKAPKMTTVSFHDLHPSASPATSVCVDAITASNALLVHFGPHGNPTLVPSFGASSVHLLYATMVSNQFIKPALGATLPWFLNHFRWIVWKCASMERTFSADLAGKYLTLDQVTFQLTRRFQRELEQSHRSVLRKIYQRDAHSGNAMVLLVVATYPTHWVLSDGWYAVFALPDEYLLGRGNKSLVGVKVIVWNASLINCNEGIDPLESSIHESLDMAFDPKAHAHLSINANSTRRVHWRLPLGLEDRRKHQLLQSLPLGSLKQRGGLVRSLRAVVMRSSGLLYLQPKDATGPRVLTEKMMEKFPQAFETAVPFLRLKVACSHPSHSASRHATLSVWRPSEDVHIVCKEGAEVFVTSVAVTWSAEKKDAELNLSTSKHSTFTRSTADDLALVHARVGYAPRTCMSIADIGPTYIGDADVCVYVIRLSEDKSHAFVTDTSLKLLSIRLPVAPTKAVLKMWQKGSIVCVRNLLVSHYDEGLGLLDSVLTDTAEATTQPSKTSYFATTFEQLKLSIANGVNQTLIHALDAYILSSILHTVATQEAMMTQDDTGLDVDIPDDVKVEAIEAHDMTIEGHPMHVEQLPDSEDYGAVVSVDVGTRLYDVYLPRTVCDQATDLFAPNIGLLLIRLNVRVQTDDVSSNSCRRWEVAHATKLVAVSASIDSPTDRIRALLEALQS
ncbi:hypothetical protein SDRG_15578 [Saprolegnia diclina VS20]|uniref:BRCA2 OB1 domain-containing protein n=1 Tax=Saprolegnia diclina (strain VS20) TaxID=1156394 RepID=T0R3L0_SAPDV|nr:hypothetical protein SDRG_15578 [Saprolegnia diclina VS20]EQC26638.1 hypothetical protein SDRG_15578 [Saprolegnia diclina VS20]|eukprot:XP_008619976.1 hypothetical protein SDRG_15578 [Saprolegnia diclina VS20]